MGKLITVLLVLVTFSAFAATYGPTTGADQLWQIAILTRPSAQVSVQQTMAALFKANPKAFVKGDINVLKPNSLLQIPSLAKIKTITPEFTQKTLQNLKWATKATNNNQQLTALQQQYNKTGKILLSFDQQYQLRLADLEHHNLLQQLNITQLTKELNSLRQKTAVLSESQAKTANFSTYLLDVSYKLTSVWAYVGAAAIFILMWLLSLYRKSNAMPSTAEEGDAEEEYDFMGSEEGIPAKLDLARAYIDMGDKKTAIAVLEEIMKLGNKEQQQEAKQLLEKCE